MKKSLETSLRIAFASAVIWGTAACQPLSRDLSTPTETSQPTLIIPPPEFIATIPSIPTLRPFPTETRPLPTPTPRPPYEINGIYLNNPELSTEIKITLKNGKIFDIHTAFITDSDPTKLNGKCPPGNGKTCTYIADGLTFIFPHSGSTHGPLAFEAIREYIEGPKDKPLSAPETTARLASFTDASTQFIQNHKIASGRITAVVRIPPFNVAEFIRNFSDGPNIAARLNPTSAAALSQAKFFFQTCGRLKPGEPNPQKYDNFAASRLLFSFEPSP